MHYDDIDNMENDSDQDEPLEKAKVSDEDEDVGSNKKMENSGSSEEISDRE